METTKVFNNGRSQTVRIPKRFRFSVPEVMIRREGNSIILTPMSQQDALKAFLALPCCPDFELNRGDATLVTNNLKHFSRIRELKLENWVDS